MKIRASVILIAIILAIPSNTNAQIGKLLKKKLEEASQTSDDKKDDEKNDKTRNSLMGLFGGGDATYEQSYNYDGRIVMEMTVYGEEGEDDAVVDYVTYMNEKSGDVAIEVKPVSGEAAQEGALLMTMIYDVKNNCALMLTAQGEQKTAIVTGMDDVEAEIDNSDSEYDSEMPDYKKSGRTKTISGYKCEEYVLVEEDSKMSMWITKDMKTGLNKKQMQKAGMATWYSGPEGNGMMMEMESFEEGKPTMIMRVKDIDLKKGKSISLDGYRIMNMGGN